MAKGKISSTATVADKLLSVAEMIASFSSDLVKANTKLLMKGIGSGIANGGQGLVFTMIYADLLHGGAYRWDYPMIRQPFYNQAVQNQLPFGSGGNGVLASSITWLGLLPDATMVTIPDVINTVTGKPFYVNSGMSISLPANSSSLRAEVIIDAGTPHILPMLLSDEAYIAIMERSGQMLNAALLQSVGTGVKTFVEAGVEAAEGVSGILTESAGRAASIAKATLAETSDVDNTLS